MSLTASVPPAEPITAVAYRRAHAGKLMVIQRAEGRVPAASDFLLLESVGTHPTGLLVTGIFDHERRGHMMASAVRDANHSEIEWREGKK